MHRTSMIVFAAFAAAALGWNPASAETFAPAPGPATLTLDSSGQNGNVHTWKIDDLGAINAVRATVRVHRLDYDPFKAPSFAVTLSGDDYKVVFDILSKNFRPPLSLQLEHWVDGKFWQQQSFSAALKLDENLDVAIDWTADGNVTVRAGTETKTMYLGAPVSSVEFSASVGEVDFAPFKVGRVRGPAEPLGPYRL
jgi:hypothetical protein